ncbi:MAG TPA: TrbI/VirB10 family protein [Xanthobacteraceae bacterium]|nr:TrbI/VirB10 family protein [Xanthobacteraceae bacterium]
MAATLKAVQQAQRHGGGRLTRTLVVTVGAVLGGSLLAMMLALHSASQPVEGGTLKDQAVAIPDMARRRAVADLEADAKPVTMPKAAPMPVLPAPTIVARQNNPVARPPSRLAALQEDEFIKALGAPQMVESFHNRTLDIPSGQAGSPGPSGVQQASSDVSRATLKPPPSPYTVTAGSVIPALLVSGIDSDLAGPVLGQVRENVFDSATGRFLLIPQGTRLIGAYKAAPASGQSRVQIAWQRLVFPDASSMDLPQMPGADSAGYSGFTDQVDHHYLRTFGTATLLSLISAGQMVGQMGAFGGGYGFAGPMGYGYAAPSQWALMGEMGGSAASSQMGAVGQQALQQGMNSSPTIEIRPGYQFNVMVTQDLVLPGAYRGN